MNELVEAIIDECKELYINGKSLKIEVTGFVSAFIVGDWERIAQVLRNLFVNAIKFSNDNSSIIVALTKSEIIYDDGNRREAIHFRITNHGVGIPEDELDSIFSPFFMSSRTKTRAGGTGLGLAIAREIIEAHHGKIWAENKPSDITTFSFVLPIVQVKKLDAHLIIAENEIPVAIQNTRNNQATILIVDDEEVCLTSMELLLYDTNYKLIKTSGGIEALDYLKNRPNTIDLIMLDLMMPDMYGLNVIAELKKDPNLCNIPIILQSGTSDNSELEKAYKMGIRSHIKKPYQKKVVLAEMNKLLSMV